MTRSVSELKADYILGVIAISYFRIFCVSISILTRQAMYM
jgi:hypothetical protein